jgi:hypothetical protein
MGNCECLRPEKENNEINVYLKNKDFKDDYESTAKGNARAGNTPFSMIDDDEEAQKNKVNTVEVIDEKDELPVKDDAFKEPEDDFHVTFKHDPALESVEKEEMLVVSHGLNQEINKPESATNISYLSDSDVEGGKNIL